MKYSFKDRVLIWAACFTYFPFIFALIIRAIIYDKGYITEEIIKRLKSKDISRNAGILLKFYDVFAANHPFEWSLMMFTATGLWVFIIFSALGMFNS